MDALNLFSTLWGLVESPIRTFKRIVLSRYKNYVIVLGALFGISILFALIWYLRLGRLLPSLAAIVGVAVAGGPVLGLLTLRVAAFLTRIATRPLGGIATQRNMVAALSYAAAPMVFSLVFLVPLQIAIFGRNFFDVNPPPEIIRPTEYYMLVALQGVMLVWWFVLSVQAVMTANAFAKQKAIPSALIVLALAAVTMVAINSIPVPTR